MSQQWKPKLSWETFEKMFWAFILDNLLTKLTAQELRSGAANSNQWTQTIWARLIRKEQFITCNNGNEQIPNLELCWMTGQQKNIPARAFSLQFINFEQMSTFVAPLNFCSCSRKCATCRSSCTLSSLSRCDCSVRIASAWRSRSNALLSSWQMLSNLSRATHLFCCKTISLYTYETSAVKII